MRRQPSSWKQLLFYNVDLHHRTTDNNNNNNHDDDNSDHTSITSTMTVVPNNNTKDLRAQQPKQKSSRPRAATTTTKTTTTTTTSTVLPPQHQQQQQDRQVRFDLDQNVEFEPIMGIMDDADLYDRWYQPLDYQNFKRQVSHSVQAIVSAAEIGLRDHWSHQRVLERVHDLCEAVLVGNNDGLANTTTTRIYHLNKLVSLSEQAILQRWIREEDPYYCGVGLERFSVSTIRSSRSRRKLAVFKAVMDLQHGGARTSDLTPSSNNSKVHDQAEIIRQHCQRISQPSALFAQVLAQALTSAVAV